MELDTKDTGLTRRGNTDSTRGGIAGAHEAFTSARTRGEHYVTIIGARDWRKH